MLSATCFTSYFTVGVLTGINLLNYMDRFTLAGMSPHKFTFRVDHLTIISRLSSDRLELERGSSLKGLHMP